MCRPSPEHEWFAWYLGVERRPPERSTRPALWERAIDLWRGTRPAFDPTFIHRDFHPGNVLWLDDDLVGIVDWANACRGPPGCDVAHCPDNLIRLSGPKAASDFTSAYQSITGVTFDPYWEVGSVLEHDLETMSARDVAHSESRLDAALADL